MTAVMALGGNAILQPGQLGTVSEQIANIRLVCRQIAEVVAQGYRVVLTHGNGPQVGNILLQNELAEPVVPAMPLDVLGAESQGQLGYLLQRELRKELQARGLRQPVTSLVTQVVVDPRDPAFANPTKPVGPFYSEAEAAELMAARGWIMREDAGRGWRRVVPSPQPVRVVEMEIIRSLVEDGIIVIAAGGGGIPVAETDEGLVGVEAVIDKDLAAQRLATDIGAEILALLTDVPYVYLHYRTPQQKRLNWVSVAEAETYLAAGHFPAGSMRSKVEGAIRFLRDGGERAVISALERAAGAIAGVEGTQFVRARTGQESGLTPREAGADLPAR